LTALQYFATSVVEKVSFILHLSKKIKKIYVLRGMFISNEYEMLPFIFILDKHPEKRLSTLAACAEYNRSANIQGRIDSATNEFGIFDTAFATPRLKIYTNHKDIRVISTFGMFCNNFSENI